MARWEGDARERLERAGLSLFSEQGYDRTSVAQIAERAHPTERSFSTGGSPTSEKCCSAAAKSSRHASSLLSTPCLPAPARCRRCWPPSPPRPEVFRPRKFLRERSAVIAASPQLQERELIKLASLSESLTTALLHRGHDARTARLATDAGMAVLRLTTERWMTDENADFADLLAAGASDLRAVAADRAPRSPAGGEILPG